MSRAFGRFADLPLPRGIRRPVLSLFARTVGADVSEAELPLDAYTSINAFFVRRLREGIRSWPADHSVLASPVDGIVGQSGRVQRGRAIQAKGHEYSVSDLLRDASQAERYENGSFLTLYLSPRHYHRIHTPCAGRIESAAYVPGSLLPVNAPAVMHVPGLFTRNERLITCIDGENGSVAVVAVGAYNVGRISAAFDPVWSGGGGEGYVTNRRSPAVARRDYRPPIAVETGAEIMAFHLGSTVVLLFEPGVELVPAVRPGTEVRVGQAIAGRPG